MSSLYSLDSSKGFKTSVHYSASDDILTPRSSDTQLGMSPLSSVKRMGLFTNENSQERMGLDENNQRLSAQVKAIQVLSTVRAMQDEIQDINQQIEAENKKLKDSNGNNNGLIASLTPGNQGLEREIEQLVSDMGLQTPASGIIFSFFSNF